MMPRPSPNKWVSAALKKQPQRWHVSSYDSHLQCISTSRPSLVFAKNVFFDEESQDVMLRCTHGDMQWGFAPVVAVINVRPAIKKQPHDVEVSSSHCQQQRRDIAFNVRVWIDTLIQHKLHQIIIASRHRKVHKIISDLVPAVNVSTSRQQKMDNIPVPFPDSWKQGSLVLGVDDIVDISALIQRSLYYRNEAFVRTPLERVAPPVRIPMIDKIVGNVVKSSVGLAEGVEVRAHR
ncbi:hypothetical protein FNYG_15543 [Fusarium nygamai]|uniref:Uncharacterized protein n=1 Tax=Gibberella nygamai TaxID=42673 RepID=A0A2K0UBR9_GIBNY|nr:hypothetical protein FNYG_15543 [Fusarium nygamai]